MVLGDDGLGSVHFGRLRWLTSVWGENAFCGCCSIGKG